MAAFKTTGFRPGNAWYLNDTANITYARAAPDGGRLQHPVLFLNGDLDLLCDVTRSRSGRPDAQRLPDLTVVNLPSGHWLPLERKAESIAAIRAWLKSSAL